MNAPLVRFDPHTPQTAASVRAHVNLIQEVMQAVMKEGTHYGKIPGTPKPSLWKPGAEVLAATFHIAPSYRIEDLSGPDFVRYRVVCVGTHQGTGTVLGEGVGECSSLEEKYKWRKASSQREFDNTPEDRRRIKYFYDRENRREYEIKQVRAECADQANTILKMACKRAQVAMTLNVLAASDIFTQDIEDLPEELRPDEDDAGEPAKKVEQPRPKSSKSASTSAPAAPAEPTPQSSPTGTQDGEALDATPLKPNQVRIIRAKLANAGMTELDLEAAFPNRSLEPKDGKTQFAFEEFNALVEWIAKNAKV